MKHRQIRLMAFQHTAARRRLRSAAIFAVIASAVSTHSRAEAAAKQISRVRGVPFVSTHSRAEAAAYSENLTGKRSIVSTHSRAEAAAFSCYCINPFVISFNTQPRGGGCLDLVMFDLV